METSGQRRRPARQRLLEAAARRFYADGVAATGIDTITADAGVAKMSLYNNFASKAELVRAYLDARHEEWLGLYRARLERAEGPAAGVLAIFDSYADHAALAYEHGFRGCGLLNAAAELPAGDEGRAAVRRHKESAGAAALGVGLGLLAASTYAVYSWAAHRLITGGIRARAAMGAVFGLGGLGLVPVLIATGGPLVGSWGNAAVGAYMAVVPMFAGYVLFGWGLAHVTASTATTLSLLEPAGAAVLAVVVVGERLPPLGWVGIALVLGCLAVLTSPAWRGRTMARASSDRALEHARL
ncbi:transcriptional regulator, TetR family [Nocardia amikacinitolerans]|uniref:EamA family transporter n=1 Tax=Nocardia amikacinitolerans TaxID=756689 RepID=UPI0020A5E753|nr:EamA family transporter [Nocardia amikacinitolerans]MCP2297067.1 transcriptional regulator, TetR family [Nocardia amikacinitolerans]